ncbi:allantoate amidohydrolase [Epidermidibacterium keratini]|uniref:Allantoate amidohydrolase n=2 Tax=Epidermidibacterium keratini TaxID=1891644 RepID=A0A7L4YY16_9ACTN|nr:allantoate amidohydrolase [Epidermidibacterium keratini]
MWSSLDDVGRLDSGGYGRFAWNDADLTLRAWFLAQAAARSLDVDEDRNGNLWAWWGTPGPGAVVTGSHLDSVPGGGAYDGPLGVASAFAAIDLLRARGFSPSRPIAVACFSDEEGARFGVACLGSRLLTGAIEGPRAGALLDADGVSLADAMRRAGRNPSRMGRDRETLSRIGVFIELHVEQGRGLIDLGSPIAVASSIWPHGRWRLDFSGQGNHAGTTLLEDRHDPMLTYAETVLSVRKRARLAGCVATVGKVEVTPGGVNAIPSHVTAWLDTRAPDDQTVRAVVAEIEERARQRGERDGVVVSIREESYSPRVDFDPAVRQSLGRQLADVLAESVPELDAIPVLGTGAGHDAGILSKHVPTGMLFVRNPTGISHAPDEYAEPADCHTGVLALAEVLAAYSSQPHSPEPLDG